MTYEETLEYLFSRLPMYQNDGRSAYKKDLTNTLALLEELENPHRKFKSVHIAGTNGKGTCAHGIAAILQSAGYNVGLYTSPHLKNFTERMKINGQEIGEQQVVHFVEKIKLSIERIQPSFFEITVAMAFYYFADEKVDIAVVETGLGGRLDSTNVITPEACLITNIGYDHMDILGDTLEKIATEKAGIIKQGIPVVIGKYQKETFSVFVEKAKIEKARLYLDHNFGESTYPSDYPYHKVLNRNSTHMLALVLKESGWKISREDMSYGFENLEELTRFKGRFQTLSEKPWIVADIGHNKEGLKFLFEKTKSLVEERGSKLHLIFGTVKDKELKPILEIFPPDAEISWTQSTVPRSLPVEELAILGALHRLQGDCYQDVNQAISATKRKSNSDDLILITGSTFIVAEIEGL
ncbi:MAG: folylpolyglutamate synthase/dihydrofolate synthase family protein [Bacteroidota bacterium]